MDLVLLLFFSIDDEMYKCKPMLKFFYITNLRYVLLIGFNFFTCISAMFLLVYDRQLQCLVNSLFCCFLLDIQCFYLYFNSFHYF
ncbi:hypothetical protein EB796_020622 [Bugula neritina]|uniref:Uncharacterized protein n=1 Tax=Bugula neritina TaxID=10212 RepID=A0A7J7J4Q3_BUGNE|nr:hypothetical protein EB796_020622 [Bugula neritina]